MHDSARMKTPRGGGANKRHARRANPLMLRETSSFGLQHLLRPQPVTRPSASPIPHTVRATRSASSRNTIISANPARQTPLTRISTMTPRRQETHAHRDNDDVADRKAALSSDISTSTRTWTFQPQGQYIRNACSDEASTIHYCGKAPVIPYLFL